MTEKQPDSTAAIVQKLEDLATKAEEMKAKAANGESGLESDVRELDRKVRELKALLGITAFDKTAYQRDYMRKKRSENPDYRPIMEPLRDMPDWRKPPAEKK